MRLQTDPTVIYGMGELIMANFLVQTWKRRQRITPIHYRFAAGCDSYAGGGFAEGCAHPAKTPYLYFVADGKGGHSLIPILPVITSLCRII